MLLFNSYVIYSTYLKLLLLTREAKRSPTIFNQSFKQLHLAITSRISLMIYSFQICSIQNITTTLQRIMKSK